jgi:hypothetical protein
LGFIAELLVDNNHNTVPPAGLPPRPMEASSVDSSPLGADIVCRLPLCSMGRVGLKRPGHTCLQGSVNAAPNWLCLRAKP